MTTDSPRPWRAALILGALAEALFAFRLTTPHKLVFDEVHYVPAARQLIGLSGPVNIEHPLLGKSFIALGILLFGDDSLGWRFFSTLAGTATVLGVFAIGWLTFRSVRSATLAGLFVLLNIVTFIQARIAMLDVFMGAFVVLGIAGLLWAMRAPPGRAWPRWIMGAASLGLATGAKWAAAPFVAYAAIGFLWVRFGDAKARDRSAYGALNALDQRFWPGMAAIPALLALSVVSIAAYAATFAPAFYYAHQPMTFDELLAFQRQMYVEQTQVLPSHPYQSSWWSWPLMIRPIWYLYENADGAIRGIFLVGNPAILWGGLVAVLLCLWAGFWHGDRRLLAVAMLWLASYAMWIIIPKSLGFFYYYYLPAILLALPLAGAWQHYGKGKLAGWDEYFVALAAGLFAYFYPIIAATALAGPPSFQHWMWFGSWP